MAMYFSEPDHSGHNYGPDSPQVICITYTAILYVTYVLYVVVEFIQNPGNFEPLITLLTHTKATSLILL